MSEKKGIADFLSNHAKSNPVSFHMPGHKGSDLYQRLGYTDFTEGFFDWDITEIPGADNLFQAEDIIAETMSKYKRLYNSKASYLLVNGTSGGIIASILTAVPAGKKLAVARNCHKSVFNALSLGHISPVYAYPSVVEEYGIAGPLLPEEADRIFAENPDVEALILPSPNYYGICSNIKAIADVVHSYGKKLIVDQAHGAHLKFFGSQVPLQSGPSMPPAAEEQGADYVINSTHKTLASLTQSAILNVCGDVDLFTLEDKLQAIESTSPSYLLMASLDINADIISNHGSELFESWLTNLKNFYAKAEAIKGLSIMGSDSCSNQPSRPGFMMDKTKINLDMSALGLDGNALEKKLMEYGIFSELTTGNILMCMTGIGNKASDYDKLLSALEEISADCNTKLKDSSRRVANINTSAESNKEGASLWTRPRILHEIPLDKTLMDIDLCEGRICAASIIPYPPGIPLICPGEELSSEDIAYIKHLRSIGEKVIGIDCHGRIAVT